ncbi:lipoprotein-releasing system ATP-binding protein [Desulfuromusa kysingii]|uniref:Lipoprotein-releasing system ATP-binding protein n=1 Tax=Desulfuromusa kysingii TaxID=37625 RepID=A0A1H3YEX7_9BACT|nr:ABC transporter ATP-binding protein [Desulfuromusa kysingii]SEA10076.1 lipoprotein-releasing system ATP-binding protein [Desulfuromusa kysingii]
MSDPVMIDVSNLGKTFKTPGGEIDVLHGVNLQICAGERVAVVGTSGAGKTTLMHILGGLDRPTSGDVFFKGTNLATLRGAELDSFRNRTIGFVFQFHQLLPEFTAVENVMMPLLIGGLNRLKAEKQATAILSEVGLEKRLTHKPGALSGGEQQRVAIARALIREPQLLLADEPTGNLDSRISDEIMLLLNQMHTSRGLTMVIVTHNLDLANSLDRILQIEDGILTSDNLN